MQNKQHFFRKNSANFYETTADSDLVQEFLRIKLEYEKNAKLGD